MKRKNLIKFLIDYNLTRNEVANYIDITANHFSLLLNGKSDPSFGLMAKFGEMCQHNGIIIEDMWELWKKGD